MKLASKDQNKTNFKKNERLNVLVVYYCFASPTRDAILSHLYCFEKYSNYNVQFVNLFWEILPKHLEIQQWDVVIFHNTFLICRPAPELFDRVVKAVWPLKFNSHLNIAIAQDEANTTDALCNFIKDFDCKIVFSLMPTDEAKQTVYGGRVHPDTQIITVLAGYVDERLKQSFEGERKRIKRRDIDIGYRSFTARARNGSLGALKWRLAEAAKIAANRMGLSSDISVDTKDTLNGAAWVNFLCRSRYQLGCEGGSNVLDRTGHIMAKCKSYEAQHPYATFEEIAAACFPGMDGSLDGAVITPRNFEYAMAGTCQVLVEGRYNKILQPNVHYIPIAQDLSNITDVFASLDDESRRKRIRDRAFRDLVESGKYHYRSFVEDVFRAVDRKLPDKQKRHSPFEKDATVLSRRVLSFYNRCFDRGNWLALRVFVLSRRHAQTARIVNFLWKWRKSRARARLWKAALRLFRSGGSQKTLREPQSLLYLSGCDPLATYRMRCEQELLVKHFDVSLVGVDLIPGSSISCTYADRLKSISRAPLADASAMRAWWGLFWFATTNAERQNVRRVATAFVAYGKALFNAYRIQRSLAHSGQVPSDSDWHLLSPYSRFNFDRHSFYVYTTRLPRFVVSAALSLCRIARGHPPRKNPSRASSNNSFPWLPKKLQADWQETRKITSNRSGLHTFVLAIAFVLYWIFAELIQKITIIVRYLFNKILPILYKVIFSMRWILIKIWRTSGLIRLDEKYKNIIRFFIRTSSKIFGIKLLLDSRGKNLLPKYLFGSPLSFSSWITRILGKETNPTATQETAEGGVVSSSIPRPTAEYATSSRARGYREIGTNSAVYSRRHQHLHGTPGSETRQEKDSTYGKELLTQPNGKFENWVNPCSSYISFKPWVAESLACWARQPVVLNRSRWLLDNPSGAKTHHYRAPNIYSYLRTHLIRSYSLLKAWKSNPEIFDIIHSKDFDSMPFAVCLKLATRARLVHNCHESFSTQLFGVGPNVREGLATLERGFVTFADQVVTVTPEMAKQIERDSGVEDVVAIPNVDPIVRPEDSSRHVPSGQRSKHTFSSPRQQAGRPLRFVFQGAIAPDRGAEFLIRAWQYIDPEKAVIHFRCDNGPHAKLCRRLSAQLRLMGRGVIFEPPIPMRSEGLESSLEFLEQFDVGVLPYMHTVEQYKYSSPRKLSHYLQAGLPVIANDLPSITHLIDKGKFGLTFEQEDIMSLVVAIEKICNVPELLKSLTINAREFFLNHYNWSIYSGVLEDVHGVRSDERLAESEKCSTL
ncbi:glycosyltransferase [Ferruginivarius sediminum]|nr:glycosyltransferase [Ferruginivarius sediminum]